MIYKWLQITDKAGRIYITKRLANLIYFFCFYKNFRGNLKFIVWLEMAGFIVDRSD